MQLAHSKSLIRSWVLLGVFMGSTLRSVALITNPALNMFRARCVGATSAIRSRSRSLMIRGSKFLSYKRIYV